MDIWQFIAIAFTLGTTVIALIAASMFMRITRLQREVQELIEAREGVYEERNQLALLCADLAHQLDMKVWTKPDKEASASYEWWVVYIQLPTGQVSWHVRDEEEIRAGVLPRDFQLPWDGHSSQVKRERIWEYLERNNDKS